MDASFSSLWLLQILILTTLFTVHAQLPGAWELLVPNAGVASMHTAVTRFNTVVLLDRTNIGPSRKMLPKGHCRYDRNDVLLKKDCYAHSVLFDLKTNQIRPLMILTDTWCSSGQFLPDGTLLQTGGDLDGLKKIRKFEPCEPDMFCDWVELKAWRGPRNYPSAGSSVMLALVGDFSTAVVVICGGAQYGAFIERSTDTPAHGSCGRIVATDPNPGWEMEDMPFGRIMGDMVMLPTGDSLIINGAQTGTQGFEMASNPCLNPVLYRPDQPVGLRFMTLNPGTVPRMYHSTANLLPDGRVLLAGSNPHYLYNFAAEFPTELRLEAFSPEYLSQDRANIRPEIIGIPDTVRYGEAFEVFVSVLLPVVGIVEVNFASAPFATHSFSQGQRLVKLTVTPSVPDNGRYIIKCTAPPNGAVAPPGYYMAFAVNQGVPSVARWVHLVA
ncbi:dynein light chain LC6, flagellar outer arm-like [Hibiscus syriacus]|uniref:Dynein light chain LC6, flagellar outer arm-like n=1 Tax=Hibiscus syriacus TaxID=106335 RepID=A0A6A3CJB1_HIBSY|nr:dynein light chain LC6, flagellar outer arm-like [Hibiscus syriacus]